MNTTRPREDRSLGRTACVTAICPEVGERDGLQRAGDHDAGVVDHRVQARRQRPVQGGNIFLVGHIEPDRGEPSRSAQARRVGFGSDPGEDVPTLRGEVSRDRVSDAPRGAGDEDSRCHVVSVRA
jgi:hypothetical protein